ncbi:(Trans)glycosidase [Glarea lozoyensis ATCC 20868]|uniref:alpha-galactosidase n=1 Tax=Glarea lozoyensis (strain ATCC 20868 / MF5171) TaxID=1116229 RepID=S3CVC5_GLAL2|nr:(Trans)glycosidase [Glarea lozoyensis ATCC 20868]EPE30352.1 (Trans)glycosidase [Glarea lozoyensis ATCC 20868]
MGTSMAADFPVGQKFQIVLNGVPDTGKVLAPADAMVWDVDAEDTTKETIAALHSLGKTVICYFSAGTYENWRPDAKQFPTGDLGTTLAEWPNEKWIRLSSTGVRNIMKARIARAAQKGCDAIDPDNTDAYQNSNGLNMKATDSIDYIRYIAKYAATLGMKTGLKNSLSIIPQVADLMSFAVNEECAKFSECDTYNSFIKSGKPVYHIEYVAKPPTITNDERRIFCTSGGMAGFSTVMKNMTLNGWTAYCDGSTAITETTPGGIIPGKPPNPHPTSTITTTTSYSWSNTTFTTSTTPTLSESTVTRTTTTSKSSTTIKTTSRTTSKTSSKTSTSKATSSTPAPGGGCAQKHWDQCGGNDWKGCTTCASGFSCKGVSPPYYYQCL